MNEKLEHKFNKLEASESLVDPCQIAGYASIFGAEDQGRDIIAKGAFTKGLQRQRERGVSIKMLWQHDPLQPIGVWEQIEEDEKGLYVKGRILPDLAIGCEALALLREGAINGLSIGYKVLKSHNDKLGRRVITALELWEVSLVTFPMLLEARADIAHQNLEAKQIATLISEIKSLRQELSKF